MHWIMSCISQCIENKIPHYAVFTLRLPQGCDTHFQRLTYKPDEVNPSIL
jgi:hypothetical protein